MDTPDDKAHETLILFDFSGSILQWIQSQARSGKVRCLLSDGIDPRLLDDDAPLPAGTVLIGLRPQDVAHLDGAKVIEVHPRG